MGLELSPRPPPVAQGRAPHCWAAATTSWLTLHRDRPQLNRQQLVDRYGDPKQGGSTGHNSPRWKAYCDDLRLYPSEVRTLLSRKSIEARENLAIDQQNQRDGGQRPKIAPERVAELLNMQADTFSRSSNQLLRLRGYVLLIFAHTRSRLMGTVSHMAVVFDTQIILEEPNLVIMDPNQAGSIRPLPMFELLDLAMVNLMISEVRTKDHKPLVTLLRNDDI